jgi:transposase
MPKQIDYSLTSEQVQQVTQAMNNDRRPEVRQRATAIHLLSLGHKPKDVANMMAVSASTVYGWHRRWREGGIEGVVNRPKSGRKPTADAAYCKQLKQIVDKDPQQLGYDFTMWTAERLMQHMAKLTGKELSVGHFREVLKQNGFVYRRPKHDLTDLQDEDAKERAESLLETLKKKPKRAKSSFSLWTKQP